MEFYKIMKTGDAYRLEEEAGQEGAVLDNNLLSVLALELDEYHKLQDIALMHCLCDSENI